ncbi:hypothetical protein [Modestobacter marinus]|uniref:hypothetical protein n=1 Tax=Modestobacter marinus TaxID=477641 RepID=UPI001C9818F9|nr:hypothetical protein [Modestobacter marinus]
MSDEKQVPANGWVDRGRAETGASVVVPGQRTAEEHSPQPPAAPPATPGAAAPPAPAAGGLATGPATGGPAAGPGEDVAGADPAGAVAAPSTPHATAPVNGRPRPRLRRPVPLVRMGPWAPVAGAGVGLVLGVVVVLLLAPAATGFDQRLALVFVVLGLSMLGAGGTLLADEVRLMRRGAWAAEARSSGAGVIAGLLNGLTPARLLILASSFVLLLSAYVTTGS